MLNIDFLRRTLDAEAGGLSTITEPRKQVIESPGGYDGIVSLVQTKGISPMVVLEQSSTGELSFRPGGFVKTSQSIWVMKMVGRDDALGKKLDAQAQKLTRDIEITRRETKKFIKTNTKTKQTC